MKKTVLREYAKLIAQVGANVQKGQEVIIYAGLDQPEFVQMVAEECYKCKAREVTVQWMYQPLEKIHTRYQSVKTLGEVKDWQKARFEHYCESKPCKIHIISDDPDGLKGMNMAKLAKARKLRYPIVKEYNDRLDGMQQWVIAAVPGKAWAKKVFPGLRTSVAMEKMWEAILTTSRVNEDPVAAWKAHNADLKARCEFLNNLGIEKLHYTADNGTNLTVGMISEAMFCGGSETSRQNIVFNPNIPTEECFISPMKGQAEGIVYSTKPLSYQGQLIENFWIRFENGKAVEVGAEKGEALLQQMVSMDEGAGYLGECALVPQASPICESGILFYNTLFDENAACHLAFGEAYPCIKGGRQMTKEQLKEAGLNDSFTHVDFMIGTKDLSIVGTTHDGREIPVFVDGNFAI